MVTGINAKYFIVGRVGVAGIVGSLPRTLRFKIRKVGRINNTGTSAIERRYLKFNDVESLFLDMTLKPMVEEVPLKYI